LGPKYLVIDKSITLNNGTVTLTNDGIMCDLTAMTVKDLTRCQGKRVFVVPGINQLNKFTLDKRSRSPGLYGDRRA